MQTHSSTATVIPPHVLPMNEAKESITPRLFVVIPTSGNCQLLSRTLDSLAKCLLPENFAGTHVVENGSRGIAEEIAKSAPGHLRVQYTHVARANKSAALNQIFEALNDEDLVFLTDDDIRFAPELLSEYARAAAEKQSGFVFGGPLRIDSEAEPPEKWRDFLPGSLTGWEPSENEFDPKKNCFLGANWAVFVGDVRRAGGFDPRFGPGSPMNATGQEWNMQRALRNTGLQFVYLPQASVWHFVEYDRYNEDFLFRRKYRGGVEAGIYWADRMSDNPRLRNRLVHPVLCAKVRYYAYSLAAMLAKTCGQKVSYLRHKMESEHARGLLYSYPRAMEEVAANHASK